MAQVIKKRKIAAGFVRANMKFWGGSQVPALNGAVNFMLDPSSVLKDFKGDPSHKQKIQQVMKTAEQAKKEILKHEDAMRGVVNMYEELIRNMNIRILSVISYDHEAFVGGSVIYRVTPQILKKLGLDTVGATTYKSIKPAAPVPPAERTQYLNAIKKMKEMETKALSSMSQLNNSKKKLKSANAKLENIVKNYTG